MNIILPIKPKYVSKILDGSKRYEYRRVVPVAYHLEYFVEQSCFNDCIYVEDNILIYETSPIKKIVACTKVCEVHMLRVPKLWEATKDYAGISKDDFYDYFFGKDFGYAIELFDVLKFDNYVDIKDFGMSIPQNFVYVNNKTYRDIVFRGLNHNEKGKIYF